MVSQDFNLHDTNLVNPLTALGTYMSLGKAIYVYFL